MTKTIKTEGAFRIHLIAASPAASLAVLSIASILGIGPQQAADRLASLPSVLADDVPGPEARRLSALLTALGLLVRLDPTLSSGQAVSQHRLDLALHAAAGEDKRALATRLARRLALSEADAVTALAEPEGLVLRGLEPSRITELQSALRRDKAVRITTADPETSVYDAFAVPGFEAPENEIARLGLGRSRFSGAIAADMNLATAKHLGRRTRGWLAIVNRQFQRYDLFLRAAHGFAPKELAGFLDVRPGGRAPAEPDVPRRIEADLPYRVAVQFATDYAAIGLEVTPHLRGCIGIAR